jgi:hypothetical protein
MTAKYAKHAKAKLSEHPFSRHFACFAVRPWSVQRVNGLAA